ncbi:MAG TPA: nuclear transport factor 2 family protein [Terriglobales bacterium]|nr:nuclear transport factor 2 family protein [Terriglobales bacterium]
MRKLAVAVLLSSACFVQASAQTSAPAAKSPSVSQSLKQLESDWADATKAADTAKLDEILGDDWLAIGYGAEGGKQTKKGYIDAVKSGSIKVESFEMGPMDVKVFGNVAVVQGSDTEKSTANGKDSSGKYVWMDVFAKRDGKWVAVRSQSALVK